ncbi:methyltransferase family protein [Tamilnaduibacter salinus]|uniref:Methyltransferase family protein n=1 Tax=Tamilnaduibacter salinus TaxID=1484056 RepID=A0A2A2I3J6_9GAMM|nr:methyltransferase [Tamilnaduibacter salinus]PAV26162.1 hypothetical protein CF392_07225 [Tamilnaduibacter salinus]PVY70052.1 methyltransferase family protein [Tamilnaduibacter salinus]
MPWTTLVVGSLSLLAVLSIAYSTVRTSVPPMPSSMRSRRVVLDLLAEYVPDQPNVRLADLGSGWGGLAIPMARRFPQYRIEGYELSWLPWLVSRLMKAAFRLDNLTLHRRNFNRADLDHVGILVTYLNPNVMAQLKQRLDRPEQPRRTLISIGFALPGKTAERTLRVNELYNTPIDIYRLGRTTNDR